MINSQETAIAQADDVEASVGDVRDRVGRKVIHESRDDDRAELAFGQARLEISDEDAGGFEQGKTAKESPGNFEKVAAGEIGGWFQTWGLLKRMNSDEWQDYSLILFNLSVDRTGIFHGRKSAMPGPRKKMPTMVRTTKAMKRNVAMKSTRSSVSAWKNLTVQSSSRIRGKRMIASGISPFEMSVSQVGSQGSSRARIRRAAPRWG